MGFKYEVIDSISRTLKKENEVLTKRIKELENKVAIKTTPKKHEVDK